MLSPEELSELEASLLPSLERHHLRLLAHSLRSLQAAAGRRSGPLPQRAELLAWALDQPELQADPRFCQAFLDQLIADPAALARKPHIDYVREAGSEGIELVMWLIARGAMADVAGGPAPRVAHRFYHVPASNTAVGHLILENT